MNDKKNLLKIARFYKPYKLWIFISILCALLSALFSLCIPYLMQHLMNTAVNSDYSMFKKYLYLAGILIVLGTVVTFFQKYYTSRCSITFMHDMRNNIASHVQDLPIHVLKNYDSGDIVSRMNNDLQIICNFFKTIPEFIFQPVLMIVSIIYMLTISWKLLIATLILIPISSIIFDKINKPIEVYSKELMEESSTINSMLQDAIGGMYILKAFNLKKVLTSKFITVTDNIKSKGLKISKLNAYLTPIFLALRLIPQLVCPLYGGYLALNKEISLGDLFAFSVLISYVFNPIESILQFLSQLRETKPAFNRIIQLIEEPVENKDGIVAKAHAHSVPLEFNNITFSYDDKTNILNKVSFKLKKGSTTAIVGPSGTGKSTILKLICKFYAPSDGTIKIFGNNITLCTDESIRSLLSYMSQESYLYPVTIAENIGIGKYGAAMEDIINAAKAANAHDFIMQLPDGYNTILGERGGNLSGGQCQRISLARMILKDAPIVLLDEPTSALDTKSEALIQEALQEFTANKTVLIVAHKLSTIKDADQIIVLNGDNIENCGTHEELMKKDNLYKKLYLNQLASISEEADAC